MGQVKEAEGVALVSPYGIDQVTLSELNEKKDNECLRKFGGVEGVAKALGSDLVHGLDAAASGDASIETHRQVFGINELPTPPPKSFFAIAYENSKDPIILLLMAAALVSTVLGAAMPEQRKHNEWLEGVAIWVAVLIVICVGAGNDYQKDLQFRKLNAQKDVIEVKVIRSHQRIVVISTDIVVGDLLLLDTGDKLICDGILVETQGLIIDEASLTGESDPIKKTLEVDPWLRSGTQVSEGSGKMLVVAVGVNSEWGKTISLIQTAEQEDTPLQKKLETIAMAIGYVGITVAVACFCALLIKWCVDNKGFPIKRISDNGPVQFFLYAITIIVVAVPEGLPLAVTISLAYSMTKMMKDNNFVRVLQACETMGGATAICSDKTGTLTENRMTVVEGWFAGVKLDHAPVASELHTDVLEHVKLNAALNSKAFLVEQEGSDKVDFVGNRTECALLVLLRHLGCHYTEVREAYDTQNRIVKLYGFSSKKKMASVLIRSDSGGIRCYNKGAAEWVLARSNRYINENGEIVTMSDDMRQSLITNVVENMAQRGLRCICLTYAEYPADTPEAMFEDSDNFDNNLIAFAIVGIKDPVRKEVPDAVAICQRAGITVRMVTGDNIHTARHIAGECGILTPDCTSMEGPDFRVLSEEEMKTLLPNLRVLARSSPEDKLILVRALKGMKEVVAVTGDGTNDAPALKESDVGLAMGIAGTEVAKEAADIVILDDNFSSIVKSVLWGRSVFTNIQKFLMFQLTVNVVGLIIAFVGAVGGGHEPLNVMQLLWVNLIMDTLGALALATEDPTEALLLEKPHGHSAPLITACMWKHIFLQAMYQLFWLFSCLYGLPQLDYYHIRSEAEYYSGWCVDRLNGSFTNATEYPSVTQVSSCNIMSRCGWPVGNRNNSGCILTSYWGFSNATYAGVPNDQRQAVCQYFGEFYNSTVDCRANSLLSEYQDNMKDEYKRIKKEDASDSLSVLFNVFIWCQMSNEINARRINDELTIFEGMHKSPIFLGVLVLTAGLQAIIMETPINMFFKVHGLNLAEWGACIAIGLACIPYSLLIRLISRYVRKDLRQQHRQRKPARVHSISEPLSPTRTYSD